MANIIYYRTSPSDEWRGIPALKGDSFKYEDFTEEQLNDLASRVKVDDTSVDLSSYYTKAEVDKKVEDVYTELDMAEWTLAEDFADALAEKADVEHEHENYAEFSDLPNMEDYYRKEEVDSFLRVKSNANHSHSNYLTESQVQALIDASLGVIENGSY